MCARARGQRPATSTVVFRESTDLTDNGTNTRTGTYLADDVTRKKSHDKFRPSFGWRLDRCSRSDIVWMRYINTRYVRQKATIRFEGKFLNVCITRE